MALKTIRAVAVMASLAFAAAPTSAETLSDLLTDYVVAFDMSEVTTAGKERLRVLLGRDDLSHAERVLGVHAILKEEEALVHVDIHDATLADLARAG